MEIADPTSDFEPSQRYEIVGLNYVSMYVKDHEAAIAFYSRVFGPPEYVKGGGRIHGWPMGSTWLTVFPSEDGMVKHSNPCNAEFAIQVARPQEVDALHAELIRAGAVECMEPEDTTMYEPMRFSCVDDPFGMRIDIYCPLQL